MAFEANDLVQQIRDDLERIQDAEGQRSSHHSEWFVRPADSSVKHISKVDMHKQVDEEYTKWRSPSGPDNLPVEYTNDMEEKILQWMRTATGEELRGRIDQTLSGVDGGFGNQPFQFSKFQRLMMSTWSELPINATVQLSIPDNALLAKVPTIQCEMSRLKGSCPRIQILDVPTAGGKTACSLAMATLLLSPSRFQVVVQHMMQRCFVDCFSGPCVVRVARMCIVASAGNTFSHFFQTLQRLMPVARRKYPNETFFIWEGMGKGKSTEHAVSLGENTVLFWIIPVDKVNEVLRAHPSVSVACMIVDEYNIQTPREKSDTKKSFVCHTIINQATPQALENATFGCCSLLKTFFDGQLIPVWRLSQMIRQKEYRQARLAVKQACLLGLHTMTVYRSLIRNDIGHLMPNGMDVHFVRSMTVTLASHITRSQVDLLPADLCSVLLAYLSGTGLTDESKQTILSLQSTQYSIPQLIDVIEALQCSTPPQPAAEKPAVRRLLERIGEMSSQCPICFSEATSQSGIMIFGCCGYCACSTCFARITHMPRQACICPFCRSSVLSRGDVGDVAPVPLRDTPPERPTFGVGGTNMDADLARLTSASSKQFDNWVNVLHVLFHHRFHRVIIVVEDCGVWRSGRGGASASIALPEIAESTGFKIVQVDRTMGGKGSRFEPTKTEFDDPSSPPMALLCFGDCEAFLYGTDLGRATAIVSVGEIAAKVLTQAMGRTMRPLPGRDPDKPVQMVKIYCGDGSSTRRRRRDDD